MELGIGLSFGLGAGAATRTVTAVPQLRLQLVTAVAFAPAAAVACRGAGPLCLEAAGFVFTAKPSSMSTWWCWQWTTGPTPCVQAASQESQQAEGVASHIDCNICQRCLRQLQVWPLWLTIVLHRYARLTSSDPCGQASLDGFSRCMKDRYTAREYALKVIHVRPDMKQQLQIKKIPVASWIMTGLCCVHEVGIL